LNRIRLNRFLALAGVASRRRCDDIIRAGRVAIDGEVVLSPGLSVDIRRQRVTLDGRALRAVPSASYLLNKPRGVVSSARDSRGGRTVLDLARAAGHDERLFPVGRLDKDSHGLILLSNDGDLAHRLIHPRFGVEKIYRVRVNLPITRTQMRRFAGGLPLSEGRTRPCQIHALPGRAAYRVILAEGRKRQIRRMFECLNRRVIDLQRVGLGPLRLGRLPLGEMRPLSASEQVRLKNAVGLR
jgi:pseudouridine synthase